VFIINENSFGFDEVLFPDNYWIDSVDWWVLQVESEAIA
jgi:hypothetical protein